MTEDEMIVEAAKRILLDKDSDIILANGWLKGVSYDMNINNIQYGNNTYQMPGKPTVNLDIAFDCTNEQLQRLQDKWKKHTFRVVLVDGDL